mmetsp:Transcript_4838/g.19360  ORF Transcript_4838/g.19360 Transcript_4838/m.19360 type:complete len:210 (+) Transcript_4838:69-698(+)|eukprot:scaffold1435_cov267-Pinguiococcus_pyrenoidosus.AAC.26
MILWRGRCFASSKPGSSMPWRRKSAIAVPCRSDCMYHRSLNRSSSACDKLPGLKPCLACRYASVMAVATLRLNDSAKPRMGRKKRKSAKPRASSEIPRSSLPIITRISSSSLTSASCWPEPASPASKLMSLMSTAPELRSDAKTRSFGFAARSFCRAAATDPCSSRRSHCALPAELFMLRKRPRARSSAGLCSSGTSSSIPYALGSTTT